MKALWEAIAIVLVISFLNLGLRAGLVVATSIPLVLAIVFIVMQIFGIDLQRISLGALIIALGLLVDDAMITIEAMNSGREILDASIVQEDPTVLKLNRLPNSIDTLSPNDPFVKEMNALPMAKRIPYHSIIGDRGRGDTPSSSDGVVPYWSSHLDRAGSEKIVPSGHGAEHSAQGIAEVLRILREHIASSSTGTRPQPSLRGTKKHYDSTSTGIRRNCTVLSN